ncbi:MAG TPA: tetratricopeptide repeat protein [Candidatus Limnocylindrales bacterium]|nr:tetratricopeptide repeat protein [Candidatus Limnocylindrales bacterium]
MTTRTLRPTGQAAAQNELLTQLGLPASASPEDVDQLHQSVSEFLAAAPADIRGWARAQVAALDSAYIALTDPVGLGGSALMSPASPPTVVPGGPATPPARRGPTPVAVVPADASEDVSEVDDEDGEPDAEALAALYASVTPSAHEDMKPAARKARAPRETPAAALAPAGVATSAAAPARGNVWKQIVLGTVAIAVVVGIGLGVNTIVNGGIQGAPAATAVAQASSGAPAVDMAKVGGLMEQLQANPNDIDALLALGTEFYAGNEMETAGNWFEKVLAIEPKHIDALLARGAVYFNIGDLTNAEATWKKVVAIEPDNVEVHYDLGFLYLNQTPTPNWAGVKVEWTRVIELDPESDLAKTVQSHLATLQDSSMMPGASGGASPTASPAASASAPVASPAPSIQP